MPSANNTEIVAAYIKAESTYNTYASPAGSDAVRLIKDAGSDLTIRWGYNGDRSYQNLGYAPMPRLAPNGRNVSGTLRIAPKGRGAAYTSSAVEVPDIHRMLVASGFTAAVTTTGGSEKWDFTMTQPGTAPGSVSIAAYDSGELFPIAGVLANLKIDIKDTGPPTFEFPFVGTLATDPSNASPSPTYTVPTVLEPTAVGVTFTLGNFVNGIIRNCSLDCGRSIDNPSLSINGTPHAGYTPGAWKPKFSFLCEMTTLTGSPFHASSAIDPYNLWEAATGLAFSMNVSSAQYNRWKLLSGALYITDVQRVKEGPIAMWQVEAEPAASTDSATDCITIRLD